MDIVFTDDEAPCVDPAHEDPLVVSAEINRAFMVDRMLVDTGSSADILFLSCFLKLGIHRLKLPPCNANLIGFTNHKKRAECTITLKLCLGDGMCRTERDATFVVIDPESAYNSIMGRPTLNALQAIVSTSHPMMKFLAKSGIGYCRGNQRAARECYANSFGGTPALALLVDECRPVSSRRIDDRGAPVEDLVDVELVEGKIVQIDSTLSPDQTEQMTHFRKKNVDVFAWAAEDMQGVDPSIITHRLVVDPSTKPFKQRKRNSSHE